MNVLITNVTVSKSRMVTLRINDVNHTYVEWLSEKGRVIDCELTNLVTGGVTSNDDIDNEVKAAIDKAIG